MKLNLVTCLWGGLLLLSVQTWAYYYDPDKYSYQPHQAVEPQTKAQDRQLAGLSTLVVFGALATLLATIFSAFISNIVNQNNGQLFPTPPPPTSAPAPPPPPPPATTTRRTTTLRPTPPTLAPSTGPPIAIPVIPTNRLNLDACSVTEENLLAFSELNGGECAVFCDQIPGSSHFLLKPMSLMDEATPNCACLSSCPSGNGLVQPQELLSGEAKTVESIDTSRIDASCITSMEDMTCQESLGNVAQLFLPVINQLECVNFCQASTPNYNGVPVLRNDKKSCICMRMCTPIPDDQQLNTLLVVSASCRSAPRSLF